MIVIQLLLLMPVCGMHVATGVLVLLLLLQLIVCHPLVPSPVWDMHELTGMSVVLYGTQLVVT